jgi:hypothetical protein
MKLPILTLLVNVGFRMFSKMRLAVIIVLLIDLLDNVSQSQTANTYFTTKSIFEKVLQNETATIYFTTKSCV